MVKDLTCHPCVQSDWLEPDFKLIAAELKEPFKFDRKLWEFWYIVHALKETKMLIKGFRGLGFGVGQEPLPNYFESLGCDILASDQDPKNAKGWVETGQYADPSRLHNFRVIDMTKIPEDLKNFDFCWSSCCFEHLGSLAAGVKFVIDSLKVLKPGGIAVHTTEFNTTSDDKTIERGGVVLYRKRDILNLRSLVNSSGGEIFPLNLNPSLGPLDLQVDYAPFRRTPVHLRLDLAGFTATSIGLIIRKGKQHA